MKKFLILIALLAGAAVILPTVSAQSDSKAPPREGGKAPGRGRGPNLEMLTKHLDLSTEQAAQLKSVLQKQRGQLEALRADESLSQEDRRARMRSIRQETDQAIGAVLTAGQKKKWQELRANRPQAGGEHRGPAEGKEPRPRN